MSRSNAGSAAGIPGEECYCTRTGDSIDPTAALESDLPWATDDTVVAVFGSPTLGDEYTAGELADQLQWALEEYNISADAFVSTGRPGAAAGAEALAVQTARPILVLNTAERTNQQVFRQDMADAPFEMEFIEADSEPADPDAGPDATGHPRNCLLASLADYALAVVDTTPDKTDIGHRLASCYGHDLRPPVVHTDDIPE